jgi:hypothetical protein
MLLKNPYKILNPAYNERSGGACARWFMLHRMMTASGHLEGGL